MMSSIKYEVYDIGRKTLYNRVLIDIMILIELFKSLLKPDLQDMKQYCVAFKVMNPAPFFEKGAKYKKFERYFRVYRFLIIN